MGCREEEGGCDKHDPKFMAVGRNLQGLGVGVSALL